MNRITLVLMSAGVLAWSAPVPSPSQRQFFTFEPNRGQAVSAVHWIARGAGSQFLFTDNGVTVKIPEGRAKPSPNIFPAHSPADNKDGYSMLHIGFEGSEPWNNLAGLDPTSGVTNYINGNDRRDWHMGVPNYARVKQDQVYKGIDMIFYGAGGSLEYDFVIHPSANPHQIRLAFDGIEQLRIDKTSGDLVLELTHGSEIRQARPRFYQQDGGKRVEVAGGYQIIDDHRVGFAIDKYDHSKPLTIDPRLDATVKSAVLFAGSGSDVANGIAVDSSGNAYVTGATASLDFPVTNGSFNHGSSDVFVAEISPNGQLLVSTLLNGTQSDSGTGIAVDATGVYVTGQTFSPEFVHTRASVGASPFMTFVVKFDLNLTGIQYSTRIGGSILDYPKAIAVDPFTHWAYVVGQTYSADFPVRFTFPFAPMPPSAKRVAGSQDVFVYRLNASGDLDTSFAIGGSSVDDGRAIAVDHAGGIWIGGSTCSVNDFPVTIHSNAAGCPGFLTRWGANFSTLSFSKYYAAVNAIATDPQDPNMYAWVTGHNTTGTVQALAVSKVDSSGNPIYGRVTGDPRNTFSATGTSIAIDSVGQVFVGGTTNDASFPGATPVAPLPPNNISANLGYNYGFISRFSPDLTKLDYSEYVANGVNSIALAQTLPWNAPSVIWTAGLMAPPPGSTTTQPASGQNQNALVTQWKDDPNLPAETQFLRMKNFWKPDEYINNQSGTPDATAIQPGWWSAQWTLERQTPLFGDPTGTPVFWIHNRWMTDEYLNIENGTVQSTPIQPGWLSARWIVEQVPGNNLYRIRNVWKPDQALNNQNGFLTATPIEPGWWSAMWTFERAF